MHHAPAVGPRRARARHTKSRYELSAGTKRKVPAACADERAGLGCGMWGVWRCKNALTPPHTDVCKSSCPPLASLLVRQCASARWLPARRD